MSSPLDDDNYKMVFSSSVGSVMAVSTLTNSSSNSKAHHIQYNPVMINPLTNSMSSWFEMPGSNFSLDTFFDDPDSQPWTYYLDLENACLGSYNGDLILSGGSSAEYAGARGSLLVKQLQLCLQASTYYLLEKSKKCRSVECQWKF